MLAWNTFHWIQGSSPLTLHDVCPSPAVPCTPARHRWGRCPPVPPPLHVVNCVPLVQDVIMVLRISQTAAVLEILHAGFGLVRSPFMTTVQQVASRIFVVWAILWAVPAVVGRSLVLASCAPSYPRCLLVCQPSPRALLAIHVYELHYTRSAGEGASASTHSLRGCRARLGRRAPLRAGVQQGQELPMSWHAVVRPTQQG